jgi:hypothetical protein
VQEANPVNPLEYFYNPGKMHSLQNSSGTALEESNKYTQIVIINCPRVSDRLDSLIGPGGLLLVVSHIFAIPVFSSIMVGLEKSKITKTWM